MNLRLSLYELAARYDLSPEQSAALRELSGLDTEPTSAPHWLGRTMAVLAATLIGLGIILWLAANWADLSRMAKFGLLEGLIAVVMLGAALRPAARAPLLLLALLAQGGTLAFFGQTYQTGADPWQLFALWAALALPLALAARSDALWVPFAIIASSGVALWTYAHTGHTWFMREESSAGYFLGWVMSLMIVAWLSPLPALQRWTQAGIWSFRTSITLAVIMITLTALSALFSSHIQAHYILGLIVLGGAAFSFNAIRLIDVFAFSVLGLALDTLLICGLARLLLEGGRGDWLGSLFMLGLVAAGLVTGTVALVRKLVRNPDAANNDDDQAGEEQA